MEPDASDAKSSQYVALSRGFGLVDLAGWSSVKLTGADRQKFLNNFSTNDVGRLAPGDSCESFFCNVKGRIVGHGLITCRASELVIIGPPRQGSELAAHLNRYIIREDVAVWDSTSDRRYLLAAGGPAARSAILELAPTLDVAHSWQRPLTNGATTVVDANVHWIYWKLLAPHFSGLIEAGSDDAAAVARALCERQAMVCDLAAFETLRIEAGLPLFGVDFDQQNLPQEIGRDSQAISFNKGCYLGQETVARIDALGHVNQHLALVEISSNVVPAAGTELSRDGAVVGRISSATYSPALGNVLALAMVRRGHHAIGSTLTSAAGSCRVIGPPAQTMPAANEQ
jgi:folate-binding protein YgfZ